MSDPLSIISGVAGVISLAIQVAQTCYSYGCAAKGAPAEVDRLLTEIMALSGVLTTVKALLEAEKMQHEGRELAVDHGKAVESNGDKSTEDDRESLSSSLSSLPPPYTAVEDVARFQALEEPLKGAREALEEVLAALKKADMRSEKRFGKLFKILKWPFKQDQTMALFARMERYKGLFVLALATSQASGRCLHQLLLFLLALSVLNRWPVLVNLLPLVCREMAKDTCDTVHEIRTVQELDRLERHMERQDARLQSFKQWLCPVNCNNAHRAARKLQLNGTGSWMLNSPIWQSWLEAKRASLWLYGIPGSGKTVLTSTLIEECCKNLDPSQAFLAYFYCDFREKESQSAEVVLGALICQICSQFETVPSGIDDFIRAHRSDSGQFDRPTFEELENLLWYLLEQAPATIIVLDALDECLDRRNLLGLLRNLRDQDKCSVKILVSSRQERDIEGALSEFERQSTREHGNQQDINSFIQSSISSSSRLPRLPPELKQTVTETLKAQAHGMFRWVQCQIETLDQLRTDRDIRKALSKLPRTLNETYERILDRISDSDAVVARRALLWLAYAPRPLCLSELAEAVVVEDDTVEKDPEASWHPNDLLLVIGSLARYSPDSDVIVLAHHSVKEFLESSYLSAVNAHRFGIKDGAGDIEIARTCLTYLLMKDFAGGPCLKSHHFRARCESYPLLPYAARYWPFHAKPHLDSSPQTVALARSLLHPARTPSFWSWMEALIAQGSHSYNKPGKTKPDHERRTGQTGQTGHTRTRWSAFKRWQPVPKHLTPLYYAASFGLTPVVDWLLKQDGVDINARGGLYGGAPLHAAVFRHHVDIVLLLLEAGADATLRDLNSMTPLDISGWLARDKELTAMLKKWLRNHNIELKTRGERIRNAKLRSCEHANMTQVTDNTKQVTNEDEEHYERTKRMLDLPPIAADWEQVRESETESLQKATD